MDKGRDDGGPAFPLMGDHGSSETRHGMSLRDYFAAHSPITYEAAKSCWGSMDKDSLSRDSDRAPFLAVWTFLRYEYADAMLHARLQSAPKPGG